jgi:OmpA-OmpF porin, OOP family
MRTLLVILALAVPRVAFAQADPATAFVLDRFEPAPAGDAFAAVPSADVEGLLYPAAALTLSYAHSRLVLQNPADDEAPLRLIGGELVVHALASVELLGRTKLEVDAPFTLIAFGSSPTVDGSIFASPTGPGTRDIRMSARVVIFSQKAILPAISASLSVWFPTGDPAKFGGAGVARYAPAVLVGGNLRIVRYSAYAGIRFQDGRSPLTSELTLGAAAALRFWRISVGPELFGTVSFVDTSAPSALLPDIDAIGAFEALVTARFRLGPVVFGASFGPGLTDTPGTPSYRALASVMLDPDLGPLGKGRSAIDKTRAPRNVARNTRANERGATAFTD